MATNSPRLYWQTRESPSRSNNENQAAGDHGNGSASPTKRSSIENLKRASRVKNSNMFAREHKNEYDPSSSPMLERPLASGRPLNLQVQGNAFGGRGIEGLRNQGQTDSRIPVSSPNRYAGKLNINPDPKPSPSKAPVSPTKSSMSSKSRYGRPLEYNPESSIWSDDEEPPEQRQLPPGKSLHRHAKSVTFDAAPPQVNEYEMTTPDPSSVASGSRDGSYDSADEEDESFDRSSSCERDDSFDASLEDTDKTPVVLPEDWRFMSPAAANDDLAAHVEDPFEGEQSSPVQFVKPLSAVDARVSPARTDSVNSNGERRPLPPLPPPGMPAIARARSDSNSSLAAAAERASSVQRSMASPPSPPSITKAEIKGMGGCAMSIEERLRLMMVHDESKPKAAAEERRERRLRQGAQSMSPEYESQDKENGIQIHEDEVEGEDDDLADLDDYKLPSRISRESILRKVKSKRQVMDDKESRIASPTPSYTHDRDLINNLDPDTPLPSLETEGEIGLPEDNVLIKQEESEEVHVYSIPDLYSQHLQAEAYAQSLDEEDSLSGLNGDQYNDDESHYSTDSKSEEKQGIPEVALDDDGALTPRAGTPKKINQEETKETHRMSLPQFAAMLGEQDFGFGLDSYLTPSPPVAEEEPVKQTAPVEPEPADETVQRPVTPIEQLQPPRYPDQDSDSHHEPGTPDSVIRHPVSESPTPDSPSVPEPVATIKAPGSKLKTRPSITPADVQAMAETRRQVSQEIPAVPPIPERHQNRPSVIAEADTSVLATSSVSATREHESAEKDSLKQQKRKSSLIPLDIPVEEHGPGFGLDKEFDRLIEAQKVASTSSLLNVPQQPFNSGSAEYIGGQGFRSVPRNLADSPLRTQKGYLMRQNTKVVVASSASHEFDADAAGTQDPSFRGTRSAGNSPRKASQQTWTTEPWNGKIRRKSIRQSGGSPQKKPLSGPVPPLPGQASNVSSSLDCVAEDQANIKAEEFEDGAERGRLFVKVVRVKDLDLPLPRGKILQSVSDGRMLNLRTGERSYFALTLDNGLHCVTTAWLELGKTAPIGQEFELVVLNDLEFQLTLQTKLEEPKIKSVPESPTKSVKTPKASTFSRVFASPKKRKELELKQQEEAQKAERQRQQQAQAARRAAQPTAWDLLHNVVAKDGSFARSYVCLKDHEANAYGKPCTVDIPCFNEWATEDQNASSVKSKRSALSVGVQRKAPYRIGKLELQLLFVPKPKGAKDEDMPKSMNACIRELKEAEDTSTKSWEGHLSQQGGDCPVGFQKTSPLTQ